MNLLVVDDEPTVRELLCAALRHAGFTVAAAATGQEALHRAAEVSPDLVLLDVMLPDLTGFEVIRLLREQHRPAADSRAGHIPVVFLTARDATQDKIEGLVLGGDDYVTKPFDLEELIARIRAVMRRTSGDPTALIRAADLELDPDAIQATRAGQPLRLSPTEFRLLHYLMVNAGRTVSKAQILGRVWDYDFNGDTNIVDTYISYLRRKIDNGGPKLIHTVHGVGYVLRGPKS
ncbi:response regulator transcription factor [Streptomyces sp. NPDC050803]|uniref:response regulator transcription factor n=1 Tax=unclassified Streptomyces TaxID=2593676 RepID=UPI00341D5AA4